MSNRNPPLISTYRPFVKDTEGAGGYLNGDGLSFEWKPASGPGFNRFVLRCNPNENHINMERPDSLLILKKYPLFEKLSHGEYKELSVSDNYKEAKQGEFIYFEAFHHNLIYFIKTGYIRLGYLDDAGNRITKDVLGPGDFFGQITLEKSNLNGEFAQVLKSTVSLCSFTIDHFSRLLNNRPDIAIKYSKLIGLRMKRFENRMINILHKDVKSRLIAFLRQLLQEAVKPRIINDFQVLIPNYLTHEEIANLIGTSRQTVTTLFNELEEAGVCIYSRKEITFFNVEKIRR